MVQSFTSTVALLGFPILALWLFRRHPPAKATVMLLLGGALFLPERATFDAPGLPMMDKFAIAALSTLLGAMVYARPRLRAARAFRGIDFLFVIACFGDLVTAYTNQDPQTFGPTVLQGLTWYDAVSSIFRDVFTTYLPFFLARAMIRTENDLRTALRFLVSVGLVYSIGAWIEARMSPQLHNWVYGFSPTDDWQMVHRMGGYRPVIFLRNGLAIAVFFVTVGIAAVTLARLGFVERWKAWYSAVVIVLCRSAGAMTYALVLLPMSALSRKAPIRAALVLAVVVLTFPITRATQLFPTDVVLKMAEPFGEERVGSLWFRFYNEDQLLARARERVVFGWGGYGRNRVFDDETGYDMTVTDGDWIIQLGFRGAVGFLCLYGMILLPVFAASRQFKRTPDPTTRDLMAALALIVAVNATDLLPNGLFHYLPFFYAGALMGVVQHGKEALAAARTRRRAHRAAPMRTVPAPA